MARRDSDRNGSWSSGTTIARLALVAPSPSATFVGRQTELTRLMLRLRGARMVTLTGAAGVGKSRLAGELANRIAPEYADGTRWVELARVSDPALVPRAAASALDVWEQPGRSIREALLIGLARSQLLMVLDNCEHLLPSTGELVQAVLQKCPGVSFLITSQAPLGLDGEHVFPVIPLSTPDANDSAPVSVARSEAAQVFCDRASEAQRGFRLTADVAPAVGEICRKLDGIPLAIELAAARVGVLTPKQIAARLNERFRLLTGGRDAALDRHRTLHHALDWSHGLLPPSEQVLLRRLSVFVGGCTLEAVEAICADGPPAPDAVLDPLAALVTKSLVIADMSGGEARYRQLETVRLFAAERLRESGESSRVREHHARWFCRMAEEAESALTGSDQRCWLEMLEAEHDNIRVALRWSLEQQDRGAALQLSGGLALFWRIRGYMREGLQWLDAALGMGKAAGTDRCQALWGASLLRHMMGDATSSRALADDVFKIAEKAGDIRRQAKALLVIGNGLVGKDPDAGIAVFDQSAALARTGSDTWCLAHALGLGGLMRILAGDVKRARQPLEECIAVARGAQDDQGLRIGLAVLGQLALLEGDCLEAERLLTEEVAVARCLGEPYGVSVGLLYLGRVAIARGDYERANTLLHDALALDRRTGSPPFACLCLIGKIAQLRGHPAEARSIFEEALSSPMAVGQTRSPVLRGLGELAAGEGDMVRAKTLLAESLTLAKAAGHTADIAAAHDALGHVLRDEGDLARSAALHHEALEHWRRCGHLLEVMDALEALAGVAREAGRLAYAVRLFGAMAAQRRTSCSVPSADRRKRNHTDIGAAREVLGAKACAGLLREGASMSLDEAVAYAQRGRRAGRRRPSFGWGSLTRAERNVVALAVEGLTNTEIGKRLFISPRTVGIHLTHVFGKLDISSRSQLAREAAIQETEEKDR